MFIVNITFDIFLITLYSYFISEISYEEFRADSNMFYLLFMDSTQVATSASLPSILSAKKFHLHPGV